jgi:hypothetical protein
MRPSDPQTTKVLIEAHVESLRGGARRRPFRRLPRTN